MWFEIRSIKKKKKYKLEPEEFHSWFFKNFDIFWLVVLQVLLYHDASYSPYTSDSI